MEVSFLKHPTPIFELDKQSIQDYYGNMTTPEIRNRVETSITFVVPASSEKHAMRLLAAEENKSISDWIRDVLYENTALKARAAEIEARQNLNKSK